MKTHAHSHQWMWPAGRTDINVKRYSFGLLLGLSLLIHLLVLAGWPSLQTEQAQLALPVADFSVQLQQGEGKTESTIPHPALMAATPLVSKPVTDSEPVPTPISTDPVKAPLHRQMAMAAQPETNKIEKELKTVSFQPTSASRHTAIKEPASENSHSHVISRLQHEFKQYFYYPRLARRKNIQGTVILGFAIDLRGTLTNIHIVRSSGFAILDMAAEDALLKLHHLDRHEDGHADNPLLELPVIYKLTEG